jgi:hypothetical protein
VEKEAELDKREAEYIRQVNAKEIDEEEFCELVGGLDLERAMGKSVAEGPATIQAMMQDEDIRESEREESAEEEQVAAVKAVESLTVGKGKWKAVPTRAKVYAAVEGPVSDLTSCRQHAPTYLLTVRLMPDVEVAAEVHHKPTQATLQEVSDQ